MPRIALIGHTGFVGSNLMKRQNFTHLYNSKNFQEMRGEDFDLVVCAGVSAVKWWANQNETADRGAIAALEDVLGTIAAGSFVLVSTVDVYANPVGVDEATPVPAEGQPYGRHRRQFEQFVEDRFRDVLVVRLPGLFGAGLKKNLIFDALNGRDLSGFDQDSSFQFYPLDRLSADIATANRGGLHLVNLAAEPVSVRQVLQVLTGRDWTHKTANPPIAYDMRTRHAGLWGKSVPYLVTAEESLRAIASFADQWRRGTLGA
jgi:nucleoside-diphosphate-sugar epimerase